MARNRIIPVFVPHAGCPHQCVFCNQKRIAGSGTKLTGQAVAETIRQGLSRSGAGAEVAFYGGSFTAIPVDLQEELLSAVRPFLEEGLLCAVRLSTRPDAVDAEVAARLVRFGVTTVELGSQSMDEAVLRSSERGHTAQHTESAVHVLRQAGLQVVLQMMTGLPGSTAASDLQTAERFCALRPDGVRVYPTVVVRDTPLFDRYAAGIYTPQTTEEAASLCAELFERFRAAGIPVLRMGLQPTEELSGGSAVAGPYHPAFGELVKSRILRKEACRLLDAADGQNLRLLVRADRISAMVGQKRENLLYLQARYPHKNLKIEAGNCEEWEIRLQSDEKPDTIT